MGFRRSPPPSITLIIIYDFIAMLAPGFIMIPSHLILPLYCASIKYLH